MNRVSTQPEDEKRPNRWNNFLTEHKTFRRSLKHPTLMFSIVIIVFFVLIALFPGLVSPHEPNEILSIEGIEPASKQYILGLDNLGRDIFSRIIYAARTSMAVSLGSVILALLIGVPLGLVSGYFGGWIDSLISRILDSILAFPVLVFAILILALFGSKASNLIFTIGFIYMPYFARLTRGSTMVVKNHNYIEASKVLGANDFRILVRSIFPNILVPITVQISLALGVSMLVEANLSFLGLGVQPPTPSWGRMILDSAIYLWVNPMYMIAPGFCIFIVILAFNLLGDGLRDVLDPKLLIQ